MYLNKCTKCGKEFETRNPKRMICPDCLYPERGGVEDNSSNHPSGDLNQHNETPRPQSGASYGGRNNYDRGGYAPRPQSGGSYGGRSNYAPRPQGDNYNRPNYDRGGYAPRPQSGGFNRPQNTGYRKPQGGFGGRPQSGGFGSRRPGGFGSRRPAPRPLLISKEQVFEIENLYRTMLPLPNPDAHEVIGEKIGLEPQKVFFGINLIRQKMMLPKLPFPKRKLAVSPEQLLAIQTLYSPLLPLPPIGCHKIIAQQLKMDEWRVHVGIGVIRQQMNLPRWNPEREDAPEEFRLAAQKTKEETKEVIEEKTTKPKKKATKSKEETESSEVEEPKPKKRSTKTKKSEEEPKKEEKEEPKKKTTRSKKTKEDEEQVEEKPVKKTTKTKKVAEKTEEIEEEPKPKKRGRTKKDTQEE